MFEKINLRTFVQCLFTIFFVDAQSLVSASQTDVEEKEFVENFQRLAIQPSQNAILGQQTDAEGKDDDLEGATESLNKLSIDSKKEQTKKFISFWSACFDGKTAKVKEFLKNADYFINWEHKSGATSLYVACQNNCKEVVTVLLEHPQINVNN